MIRTIKKALNMTSTVAKYGQRQILGRMNMLTIEKQQFDLLINGKIVPPTKLGYFPCINPSTGEVFSYVADAAMDDMKLAIDSARKAFDQGVWPKMTIAERGIYLKKLAGLIRQHAKVLADLESVDCGKTIKQSTFIDVPTAADCFDYFSNANVLLADRENKLEAPIESVTKREPIGVVGCIIPWNYPIIMTAWKIAPALIAGNCVIFKPSAIACASVMKLAQLIEQVGFPEGVINIVPSANDDVARFLVRSAQVDMISFTGGTQTGRDVMTIASETPKKVVLELGGKSPNIVFADCNMEAALGGTMSSIFMNQGQMCTACSRLYLDEKIYNKFLDELVNRTKKLKIGESLDYQTQFGPVISQSHRDRILKAVEAAVKEGAKLECGGKIPSDPQLANGFFIEPTILSNVKPSMQISQEENFGPVLCVTKFSETEEAVKFANDSVYGLAACVWTQDLQKAKLVAQQIKAGTVWVNTYGGFYNEASFGGYKQSGFGRELGVEGLFEYTQTKHVCIDKTPGGKPLVSNWF